jgi:hypothetical protein
MRKCKKVYALYHGDEILTIGTMVELAKYLGVSKRTIHFYTTPTHKKRTPNGYLVIRIEE